MKEFKVYQATIEAPYVFFDYDLAEGKIKKEDYTLVCEGQSSITDNINRLLEDVFRRGNMGELEPINGNMRSVSVSDIIEVDGKYYYVEGFGFKELTPKKSAPQGATKYTTIYKDKMTQARVAEAFKALESLGYHTVLSNAKVGPRNEVSIWVATRNDNETIYYSNCCFAKECKELKLCPFTVEEYNLIKEVK